MLVECGSPRCGFELSGSTPYLSATTGFRGEWLLRCSSPCFKLRAKMSYRPDPSPRAKKAKVLIETTASSWLCLANFPATVRKHVGAHFKQVVLIIASTPRQLAPSMHIHMYLCMNVCMHACMHACIHVHAHMRVWMYACK